MTTTSDMSAPGGWQVGSQTEGYQRNAQGQVVHGVTVHFALSTGTASSVFVPDATYGPVRVRAMIAAKAKLIQSVGGLSTAGGAG